MKSIAIPLATLMLLPLSSCGDDTAFGVASVCDIGDTDRDNADITQSRSLTVGTVEGQSVNCWGTVDVTGTRAN